METTNWKPNMEFECLNIWIDSSKKILSFQSQLDFEEKRFQNNIMMWKEVRRFIDDGYRVQ